MSGKGGKSELLGCFIFKLTNFISNMDFLFWEEKALYDTIGYLFKDLTTHLLTKL